MCRARSSVTAPHSGTCVTLVGAAGVVHLEVVISTKAFAAANHEGRL